MGHPRRFERNKRTAKALNMFDPGRDVQYNKTLTVYVLCILYIHVHIQGFFLGGGGGGFEGGHSPLSFSNVSKVTLFFKHKINKK